MANSSSPKKFSNEPYVKRVEKPWGWEIHWTPDDKPYTGKILHIKEGARLSLQKHDKKLESWWLLSGRVMLIIDNNQGELEEIELRRGLGYSCQAGQRHRFIGITDCDIIEVSTPEIGITYRLEDDYKRENETEEIRKQPNRGWKG